VGVKLYYGGFGDYQEFTVAEDEPDAIKKIGEKINAPFLPITVKEISEIDGFKIQVVSTEDNPDMVIPITEEIPVESEKVEPPLRHCRQCDFTCDNQGVLMRHYATEHPKGD